MEGPLQVLDPDESSGIKTMLVVGIDWIVCEVGWAGMEGDIEGEVEVEGVEYGADEGGVEDMDGVEEGPLEVSSTDAVSSTEYLLVVGIVWCGGTVCGLEGVDLGYFCFVLEGDFEGDCDESNG